MRILRRDHLQVFMILGSPRLPSHTGAAGAFLAEQLVRLGAIPYVWNLAQRPLPIAGSDIQGAAIVPVEEFQAGVRQSDALVWMSPVHHSSFTGLLKNSLDYLSSELVGHKPVAVMSNGGGVCSIQACDQLRVVARALSTVVIATQVVTSDADYQFLSDDYVLMNPESEARITRLALELIAYADSLRPIRLVGVTDIAQRFRTHAMTAKEREEENEINQ